VILRAAEEDVSALADLEHGLFGVDAWSADSWRQELAAPTRVVLVATNDLGTVVGYAVTLTVGDVADLLRIAVAADHQRRGLASDLLDACLRAATADGVRRLLLEVSAANGAAIEFYRAHQFVTIDRRVGYYRDGSDALVMERQVPLPDSP
jgi:[ribosomal protein S18]-alanine N-acetyltransferase